MLLTVGCILRRIETALACALSARRCYAMPCGAWPVAAPCFEGDGALDGLECGLVDKCAVIDGMLRFSLTDEAIMAALPDGAASSDMDGRCAQLLDRLFAGAFPLATGFEAQALMLARAQLVLRGKGHAPPEMGEPSRTLLWLSAQALCGNPRAPQRLGRALRRCFAGGADTGELAGALAYCRAALVESLEMAVVGYTLQ